MACLGLLRQMTFLSKFLRRMVKHRASFIRPQVQASRKQRVKISAKTAEAEKKNRRDCSTLGTRLALMVLKRRDYKTGNYISNFTLINAQSSNEPYIDRCRVPTQMRSCASQKKTSENTTNTSSVKCDKRK